MPVGLDTGPRVIGTAEAVTEAEVSGSGTALVAGLMVGNPDAVTPPVDLFKIIATPTAAATAIMPNAIENFTRRLRFVPGDV